jgi:hypothetical protein
MACWRSPAGASRPDQGRTGRPCGAHALLERCIKQCLTRFSGSAHIFEPVISIKKWPNALLMAFVAINLLG